MAIGNYLPGGTRRKAARNAASAASAAASTQVAVPRNYGSAVARIRTTDGALVRVNRGGGTVNINVPQNPLMTLEQKQLRNVQVHSKLYIFPNMEWATFMLQNAATINLCIQNLPLLMESIGTIAQLLLSRAFVPLLAARDSVRGNQMKEQLRNVNMALSSMPGGPRKRSNLNTVQWIKFIMSDRDMTFDMNKVQRMVNESNARGVRADHWQQMTRDIMSLLFDIVTVFNITSLFTGEVGSLLAEAAPPSITGLGPESTQFAITKLKERFASVLSIFYAAMPGFILIISHVLPKYLKVTARVVDRILLPPPPANRNLGEIQSKKRYNVLSAFLLFPLERLVKIFPPEKVQEILFVGLGELQKNLVGSQEAWAKTIKNSVTRQVFNVGKMTARGMSDSEIKAVINQATGAAGQIFSSGSIEVNRITADKINKLYRQVIDSVGELKGRGQGYLLTALGVMVGGSYTHYVIQKRRFQNRLAEIPVGPSGPNHHGTHPRREAAAARALLNFPAPSPEEEAAAILAGFR